jgi:hypothetical protein
MGAVRSAPANVPSAAESYCPATRAIHVCRARQLSPLAGAMSRHHAASELPLSCRAEAEQAASVGQFIRLLLAHGRRSSALQRDCLLSGGYPTRQRGSSEPPAPTESDPTRSKLPNCIGCRPRNNKSLKPGPGWSVTLFGLLHHDRLHIFLRPFELALRCLSVTRAASL